MKDLVYYQFLGAGVPLMGPSEGKIMEIDTASRNKNHEIWPNIEKSVLGSLQSPLRSYHLRQNFRHWQALSNDILRSKICPVPEKVIKFNI